MPVWLVYNECTNSWDCPDGFNCKVKTKVKRKLAEKECHDVKWDYFSILHIKFYIFNFSDFANTNDNKSCDLKKNVLELLALLKHKRNFSRYSLWNKYVFVYIMLDDKLQYYTKVTMTEDVGAPFSSSSSFTSWFASWWPSCCCCCLNCCCRKISSRVLPMLVT